MSLDITSARSLISEAEAASFYSGETKPAAVLEIVEDTEAFDLDLQSADISLPILATGNDMREMVRFLKSRSSGVTFIEAMNAEPRRIFDARKIAAYEFWGIVERSGERLRLSELGRELAERIDPECEIYRRILSSVPAYYGAIQFFYEQKLEVISAVEAATYWKSSYPELNLDQQDEKSVQAIAVSFFSICHAAELGTTTIGKRGQPARLRIDMVQVSNFLEPQDSRQNVLPLRKPERRPLIKESSGSDEYSQLATGRVYLSIGTARNNRTPTILENLHTALELAGFEDFTYHDTDPGADFLPASQLDEIQQCRAAVFLLDDSVCAPKQNAAIGSGLCAVRLAEISVAQALLNGRVAVIWNTSGAPPPECLRKMGLHFFTCKKFDWETGASLVKLLKGLRR